MNPDNINKFDSAQEAHIKIIENIDPETFALLEQMCPAGLYWHDEKGQHYNYLECLECGACRVIAGDDNFIQWNFPANGKGVDYTQK